MVSASIVGSVRATPALAPCLAMRFSVLICTVLACAMCGSAIASDASDCEDEASKLRKEASDVEDAASRWRRTARDEDAATIQGRQQAQRAAEAAYYRAGRMMRACKPGLPTSMAVVGALANIKGFLMVRFGDTPATRARVAEVEAGLQGLARIHARVQPPDYGMTYAAAEAIFSEGR